MRSVVSSECIGLVLVIFCVSAARAWLPGVDKIRGVNLGGLFIVEPWMMNDEWNSMGCGGLNDEFSCVQALGQEAADAAFEKHWSTWVTQDDINQIRSHGLNTLRIPLGFWIHEELVNSDEFYPRGGFAHLENVCSMAKAAGLYIILVLHAAPGGQSPNQQFTGHAGPVGFFNSGNYERAYEWLEWITTVQHTHPAFGNVGAIEIVNEPVPADGGQGHSLLYEYYPTAWARIRAAEDRLQVTSENRLHIQMMDARWNGLGNPTQGLGGIDIEFALYDDHNYRAYDGDCEPTQTCFVPPTRRDYLFHSCFEDLGGAQAPLIVGEWSLATDYPNGNEFDINRQDAVSFYASWFGAQIHSYEKEFGWIFWTWKVNWIGGRNDWRWGYQQAVGAGVIPTSSPSKANDPDVCANLHMIIPNATDSPSKQAVA